MKMKLSRLISLFVIGPTVTVYFIAVIYLSLTARDKSFHESQMLVESYAKQYAQSIECDMNATMSVVRTLAQAFLTYEDMTQDEWQPLYDKMYHNVFIKNTDFYCLWDSWELNRIDTAWSKPTGRIAYNIFNSNGVAKGSWTVRSLDGDTEQYAELKRKATESLMEPYLDNFQEGKQERKLMTSVVSPILNKGTFIGLVGVDITLDEIKEMVEGIHPYQGSYAFLVSNQGACIGHPEAGDILAPIETVFGLAESEMNILQNVQLGESFSFKLQSEEGEDFFYIFSPIQVDGTDTPWSLAIAVPEEVVMTAASKILYIGLIIGFVGLFIISIIILYVARIINKPINTFAAALEEVSEGKLKLRGIHEEQRISEIDGMRQRLVQSVEGLEKKTQFASEIGSGKLDTTIELASEHDQLGKALIDMRDSLIKAKKEEEIRMAEDQKRSWANEGIALFANLLRKFDDLDVLAYEIIKELVKYLGANQGGIFIIENERTKDAVYRLQGAYAYNRKKFLEKLVYPGDGILGQCALEKQTIYLKDVPDDYLEITSGLGDANPGNILIVPLLTDEYVIGMFEIASFETVEDYKREFVEKVAESVASVLQSVRINEHTRVLLEQTRQQSEEMQAQEEEMRQNMEEMIATQEELQRKELDLIAKMEENDRLKKESEDKFVAESKKNEEFQNQLSEQLFTTQDALARSRENETKLKKELEELQKMMEDMSRMAGDADPGGVSDTPGSNENDDAPLLPGEIRLD